MFVDELELLVRGGRGGNGAVSFRREKYVPHGGPDGGDGGDGGNVYLYADSSKHSFLDLRYLHTLKAADGAHGRGRDQHGARGADLLVPVPLGTIVRDDKQRVLADLTSAGQKAKVAAGGKGGRGNARFASSRKRVPRVAEKGLPGFERILKLELKLIAQVGLVGFPNAGKSTLLGRISSAKPKVAAYPFTTLVPNLGVVKVGNEGTFVVADLPGLIEGAHQGAGLGHQFLRHVERNLLLLFLIDLSPDAHPAPTDAYRLLKDELNIFSSLLANYPRVIVGNKIDLPGAAENMDIFRRIIAEEEGEGIPLFAISAVTGEGVDTLVYDLFRRVNELAAESGRTRNEEVTLIGEENITEKPLTIEKTGEIFMVSGDAIERMAAITDFENEEALKRFQHFCSRIGLDKKLKKAGISEGDTVRVGEEEFYFYE